VSTVHLQHNRVTLALHCIKEGTGRPLLLLHGLSESAANMSSLRVAWNGPIWALDFTGHGQSHIGEATIVGRGLGGYIAFLIAGARPQLVRGAVIMDGPGLSGGAIQATSSSEIAITDRPGTTPDPWALIELSRDARPPNYAVTFVHLATTGSSLDEPIAVTCKVTPPWVEAIRAEPGVMTDISMQDALDIFAAS